MFLSGSGLRSDLLMTHVRVCSVCGRDTQHLQGFGGSQPAHGRLTLMQFIKIDVNYKTLRMDSLKRFAQVRR